MARARRTTDKPASSKRPIEQYDHKGQQQKNNPQVGLELGAHKRVAVKIMDDCRIESLKIVSTP